MRRRVAAIVIGLVGCSSSTNDSATDAIIDAVAADASDAAVEMSEALGVDAPSSDSDGSDAIVAPSRVYGVTTDSIAAIDDVVAALAALPHRPTTRIVFDEIPASTYVDPAKKIHAVSDVMGELVDSFYMKDFTLDRCNARTDEYLATLGSSVDVWEIGNEINGDWLGDTASVVTKMTATFDRVRKKSLKTALTLYWFEPSCMPADASHEMFAWVDANVPSTMRSSLDWVLISYYEQDCGGARPDWPTIFHRLALAFPNSKIGLGEVGTKDAATKADYVRRYYDMKIDEPHWIGGHFWWYFHEDMAPKTQPLFGVLSDAMAAEP